MYIEIILPLYLIKEYTYHVPDDLADQVMPGKRVLVQFGKSKIYAGLIKSIVAKVPTGYEPKSILEILDEYPIVNAQQLKLWQWIADYYLCTLGEVMLCGLPSSLKLESTAIVSLHPAFIETETTLTDREFLIVEALHSVANLEIKEVEKIVGTKAVFKLLKTMVEKNIIQLNQEIDTASKARKVVYVELAEKYKDENNLRDLFSSLELKAPKQFELLLHYLNITMNRNAEKAIPKTKLIKTANSSSAIFNQMHKKEIFVTIELADFDIAKPEKENSPSSILSPEQITAYEEIMTQHTKKDIVLLHGVTSSGKTEIYIKLIENCARNYKQVMYLLPEIALTTQMIKRLQKHFGDKLLVYHSLYNETERLLTWNKMLKYKRDAENRIFDFQIIIGARSALFLPYSNLGLVIIDEEHEPSFKQYDPAPRYHARDAAMVLAKYFEAKVVLGSATPSIETYYNSKAGKFGLVELNSRFGNLELPSISIVDLKEEYKRKKMKGFFSQAFLTGVSNALAANEQVILFQNRRGFATMLECKQCGWAPQCINCDVTLSYHKISNQLSCHYCGYKMSVPQKCMACSSPQLETKGIGTERIEEEMEILFPEKKIARLDLDTTRTKNAYRKILSAFEEGETDILVGTQMITKGLDFDNVSTIGIVNADTMLNFPDFRAAERSLQLMLQVSGRSGRKNKQGKVIIQSYRPAHPVLQYVLAHDYLGFYDAELKERKLFGFPPFTKLIEITLKHKNLRTCDEGAIYYTKILKDQFAQRVLGPSIPHVSKISNFYLRTILLKIENNVSLSQTKKMILTLNNLFWANPTFRSIIIHADVDPL